MTSEEGPAPEEPLSGDTPPDAPAPVWAKVLLAAFPLALVAGLMALDAWLRS